MRFLMVTGVSKFAKTSIFSAFNNPKDLTLDAYAADPRRVVYVGVNYDPKARTFDDVKTEPAR